MKKLLFAAIATLFLTACNGTQQPPWEYLFNGHDLTGWTRAIGQAEFVAEDGVIIGTARRGTGGAFLRTDKEFDNFILEFEFKVTDGLNSGIQIRSHQRDSDGRVYGYQFEVDPLERAWTGGIFDEARRGWLYPLTFNQPARAAFRGEGEWNSGRIEAIGPSIRGWLNGVPSCDLWCDMTSKGFIALQVHGSNMREDGATASFRNIRILTEDLERWATPNHGEIVEINAIPNTLSPREREEGWQLLWDGRTTNGWNNAEGWSIENGMLIVEPIEEGEHLVTNRSFGNFWLSVDFRVTSGASSGIFYLVDEHMNGLEFQTIDNRTNPHAVGKRTLGSLFDLVAAPEDATSEPEVRWGHFNTAWIKVNGNTIEHWLNGIKLFSVERNNPAWNDLVRENMPHADSGFGNQREGRIFLQHSGSRFYFRNIKIKELP